MHDGPESDAELIRASEADPELFRALFERHFEAIFRYFGRRLGREAADDLTAEVFLRAFESRGKWIVSRRAAPFRVLDSARMRLGRRCRSLRRARPYSA